MKLIYCWITYNHLSLITEVLGPFPENKIYVSNKFFLLCCCDLLGALGVVTIGNGLLRLCTVSGLAVGVIEPMNVVMVVLWLKADLSSRTTQR